ncbi:MAG: GGDEF domain-containing protein [Hyphomicrobiales bacterium]|nr:GGDEF domain-containing protein [Hyphomicrobiales bacterium]MCP5374137.1 GGDEF domain-containing protein [Hyphomicrobiales bacterium]
MNGNRFWLAALTAAGMLAAAWAVAFGHWAVVPAAPDLLDKLPYAIAALGAGLALRFHRSRLVFAFALLALAHGALAAVVPAGAGPGAGPGAGVNGQLLYPALALLWPVTLTAVALSRDRGVFTRGGLRWWVAVALMAAAVLALAGRLPGVPAGLVAPARDLAVAGLHFRLLGPAFDAWTWLPQPAILAFLLGGVALLVRVVRDQATDDLALLGALAAGALALHFVDRPAAPTWFLAAGAAAAFLALVQQAYGLAFLDELTGLPGRRALMTDMARLGARYAVAMVDIDHFKRFNDKHGHDVGDQVLRLVAVELSRVGGGGRAYRYGGEEFTILFPGATAADAQPVLDAVRRAVAEADFRLRTRQRLKSNPNPRPRRRRGTAAAAPRLRVTVSMGVAEARPGGDGDAPPQVIKAADKALYRAKAGGRNRVVAAPSG